MLDSFVELFVSFGELMLLLLGLAFLLGLCHVIEDVFFKKPSK